jgi:hypothetical protein
MRVLHYLRRLSIALIVIALTSLSASADIVENVSIDTSAVAGADLKVVFDVTANTPFLNTLNINNFSAPGSTMGLPETTGGLIDGDLILGLNPAPFTFIQTATFFNELIVNLAPVSNQVTFTLDSTTNAPASGVFSDEVAFYLLDSSYNALFPTTDPLGANALFTIDLAGASTSPAVYSPATQTSPSGIQITVPGSTPATVPEPSAILLTVTILGFIALKMYVSRRSLW